MIGGGGSVLKENIRNVIFRRHQPFAYLNHGRASFFQAGENFSFLMIFSDQSYQDGGIMWQAWERLKWAQKSRQVVCFENSDAPLPSFFFWLFRGWLRLTKFRPQACDIVSSVSEPWSWNVLFYGVPYRSNMRKPRVCIFHLSQMSWVCLDDRGRGESVKKKYS